MEKSVKESLDEITYKFNEQLEIYAAAFVKHMGTDKASEYALVQQVYPEQHKVVYRYEHRDTLDPIKQHQVWVSDAKELLAELEIFTVQKPDSILCEIPVKLQVRLLEFLKRSVG